MVSWSRVAVPRFSFTVSETPTSVRSMRSVGCASGCVGSLVIVRGCVPAPSPLQGTIDTTERSHPCLDHQSTTCSEVDVGRDDPQRGFCLGIENSAECLTMANSLAMLVVQVNRRPAIRSERSAGVAGQLVAHQLLV